MALTKKEYDALGEAEYMIDDALVIAAPITFGGFCEKYDFEISIVAENPRHIFFPRNLFEAISAKSNY